MSPLSLCVVLLMFKWLPAATCYSYQTKLLTMTFAELAALEAKTLGRCLHVESVAVKCFKDSMEVVVVMVEDYVDVYGLGFPVHPTRMTLGPVGQSQSGCQAVANREGAYTFRASHGGCGTKLTVSLCSIFFSLCWTQ